MRVALAPDGSRGDVAPMLALAQRLRALGHGVVVCAPADARAPVEAGGFEFRSVSRSVRAFLEREAPAITGGALRQSRAAQRYFALAIEEQFENLPGATADADLVIGAGVQLAAPSAAELHGVPYRYVAYCPALLRSALHPPAAVRPQRLPAWANRLAWRGFVFDLNRRTRASIDHRRAILGLAPVADPYRYVLGDRPVVLACDARLGPAPPDFEQEVEQVGYLHPEPGEPLPAKLESLLESGPPPVYLGFGSMTDPDPAATTRLLVRAVAKAGRRAILSQGWARLGDVPLPGAIQLCGPVDHGRLFPRVAAVVHHGGADTTATAARAGVPQVPVPHLMDQFYWADRASRLGLATPGIPRRRLDAQLLANAIRECLDNEVLRERAREIGQELRAVEPFDLERLLASRG